MMAGLLAAVGDTNWHRIASPGRRINSFPVVAAWEGTILGTGDIPVGFTSKFDASKAELHLYPNPASSELHLEIASDIKNIVSQITVFSPDGKEVLQKRISLSKGVIDISSLRDGIYFFRLTNKEGIFNGKFVKK